MAGSMIAWGGQRPFYPKGHRKNPHRKQRKSMYNTTNRKVVRKARGINRGFSGSQPFPQQKICTLCYAQQGTLYSGTLQLFGTEQSFRVNSLFDPDKTGTGHQPMGFDQLMLLYFRYKVFAVKAEITWTNPSADGITVGYKLNNPADGANLGGMSVDRATESLTVRCRKINDTGSQVVRQTFYIPMYKLLQVTRLQFDSNLLDYTGSSTTSPGHEALLKLAVANPMNAVNQSVEYAVKFTFFTRFYQRVALLQS